MNAKQRHEKAPQTQYAAKGAVLKSTIFHVLLFTITAIGVPFIAKDPLVINNPINVEIIDIDELSQTNRAAPPQPKKEEPKLDFPPEPAKETPKQMTSDLPPDLLSPTPPDIEEVDDVPPPPEPELAPKKKVKEEKPKPKKPKAKPKPPVKKKTQADSFASLLKNLTPEEDAGAQGKDEAQDTQENAAPISQIATLSDQMTISELDALRQQIAPCWNVPAGAKYAENLVVETRVIMNRDASVQSASILNQSRYNQDSHFRAAADAAMRALRNPRCQPLKLPADKYDQWKTIIINFDPREML